MSAAEDPRPVLWTSVSCTSCGQKGGIFDKENMVLGRFMDANYTQMIVECVSPDDIRLTLAR
jgi:hypothetical protein